MRESATSTNSSESSRELRETVRQCVAPNNTHSNRNRAAFGAIIISRLTGCGLLLTHSAGVFVRRAPHFTRATSGRLGRVGPIGGDKRR